MSEVLKLIKELFSDAGDSIKPVHHAVRMTLRSKDGRPIEHEEATFHTVKISKDGANPNRLYIQGVNPPPNTVAEIFVPKNMWHAMVKEAGLREIDATDQTIKDKIRFLPEQIKTDLKNPLRLT